MEKITNILTQEELTKVFEKISTPLSYGIPIMLYTGIRLKELLDTKLSDVDMSKRTMHVRGTKNLDADRIVPIHSELIPYIEKLLKSNHEYLIENSHGQNVAEQEYRRFFKIFMKDINAQCEVNDLRHTFIALMKKNGVERTTPALKNILGQACIFKSDNIASTIEKLKI